MCMDMTKGIIIGALIGVSVGLLAGVDKSKKDSLMRSAKRTVTAMKDTFEDAVDFTD